MIFIYVASVMVGAIVLLKHSWWRRKFSVPGRKHSFYNVLGDLIEIDLLKELIPQTFDIMGKIMKSFPQEQLVCMWFSYYPVVFVAKSDAVKEMLKTHKVIGKRHPYKWLKPLFGNGLATKRREQWKSHRRMINPCFHSDVLRNYLKSFNEISQKLVKVLEKESQKDFTYIINPLSLCALDIICETVFGTKIGALESGKMEISNCLKWCESYVMKRIVSIWYWPDFIVWNTKFGREAKRHINKIQEFSKNILEKKKVCFLSGEKTAYNGKYTDLIDVLLEKQLDAKELSEQDVIDEVITFMMAGHDTVAIAAMWSLYLIGHHPDVQAKIHEEVDSVFRNDTERHVTVEDLKNLQYMDCVLKECQRLYPAVPAIGRCTTEEIKICGSTVPKGTTCIIPIYHLHRDKDVFPDPEVFDPDRFSVENRSNIPEFGYILFSAGPRNCIGFRFAELELGIIISYVFRNFTIQSVNKVFPLPGISLHASEPIRIKIRSRTRHQT